MKGKYLRRFGSVVLATLMLSGIAFMSSNDVQAQGRQRGIGRPNPHRIHRPFRGYRSRWGYPYGYNRWGWGYPYGYYGWGYDPWSPYGSRYRQYVFDNSDKATSRGYKDGFKTGKDDGKKAKSYNPERSHYFRDSGFGNFADVYRSGFSSGYQEGYKVGGNERAS